MFLGAGFESVAHGSVLQRTTRAVVCGTVHRENSFLVRKNAGLFSFFSSQSEQ